MAKLRARTMAAAAMALLAGTIVRADELTDAVTKQKAAAKANWNRIFPGETAQHVETAHLLLYGPASLSEKRLKELGKLLETEARWARKALHIGARDKLWPGKLAVYLFEDRRQFRSFMLAVAKKRPDPDDLGIFSVPGAEPYVAAGPPRTNYQPGLEGQAGEQLGAAILTKKAGINLPVWVVTGFGRATVWQATRATRSTREQRQQVRKLVAAGRSAQDVWGGQLAAEEAPLLRASLLDFLAYGPGAKSFGRFLEGFKSKQPNVQKTTEEALKAARINGERLNRLWRTWALQSR